MFKDDRMISILTAIIVMAAIGTVIQRADMFGGSGGELALVDDDIIIEANSLTKLDIFANDTGISDAEKQSLIVRTEPECGRVLARRGVLQYYAGDECAGAQKIVYTLSTLQDAKTATVNAFVVSDLHPDIRPDAEPKIAETESPPKVADGDSPADKPADADGDGAGEAVLAGRATPADAETTSAAGAANTTSEPDAARTLPGGVTDTPKPGNGNGDAVIAAARGPDTDTRATLPERLDTPTAATDANDGGGSMSLALVRPDDEPRGPKSTAGATLAAPDRQDEAAPFAAAGTDAGLAGRGGPDGFDLIAVPGGHPDGKSPPQVKNTTAVAALSADEAAPNDASTGAKVSPKESLDAPNVVAERKVAALSPADKRFGRGVRDEQFPLGTDILPRALQVTGRQDADTWRRLTVAPDATATKLAKLQADDPAKFGIGATLPDAGRPTNAGTARPDLPKASMGGAGRLAARTVTDKRDTIHPSGSRTERPNTANSKTGPVRLAALAPDFGKTPRVDLMNRSAELDPVTAGRESGEMLGEPAVDGTTPAAAAAAKQPKADRIAVLVRSGAASSYSFFTTVPKGAGDPDGQLIVGMTRPAGSWAADNPDGAPKPATKADTKIAALPVPTGKVTAVPGLEPALARLPTEEVPGAGAEASGTKTAALPSAAEACTVPPATELEIRRAARTVVRISAPCQADTIAELSYSGLRLAIPLDREGRGGVVAPGFEANATAVVRFADETKLDFDLPFPDVGRIERVAVIWDVPVALELHALEFGADTGDKNHVHPGNQRKFKDVRRKGGGFLLSYRSHAGVGQNAQIYTHWRRGGAQSGIVKLMIDFASRNRDRLEGSCGEGLYAAPGFVILRSSAGRLERPVARRLAALPCSLVSQEVGDKRLISGAIDDLVVTN